MFVMLMDTRSIGHTDSTTEGVVLSPVLRPIGNVSLRFDSISARPLSSISARAPQGETHGGIVIANEA
jgi:hypothetical protein